jgi:ATP-dependent exoDNAse (exonuclease V) beta subunit
MTGVAKDNFCELAGDKSVSEAGYLRDDYRNPTAIAYAQLDILTGKKISGNPIRQAKIMEICEDLRLLYVAFTRARERLFIGSHKMVTWGEKRRPLRSSIIFQYLQNYVQAKQSEVQTKQS